MKGLMYGAFAGVWFAICNYIMGVNSHLGALSKEVSENGSLIFIWTVMLFFFIKSIYNGNSLWEWRKSNFRNPSTGGFYWHNFLGWIVYTIIMTWAGFVIVYAFKFATFGNMNKGSLTSLFGLSSIFSAIIAYFLFGDKLKGFHVSRNWKYILIL